MVLAITVIAAAGANAISLDDLSPQAAAFADVPELMCDLARAIYSNTRADPPEPVDWDEIRDLYQTPGGNLSFSLQDLAQGAAFSGPDSIVGGDVPGIYQAYQEYFGDDEWLHSTIIDAIENLDNELDLSRVEPVHKTSTYATAVGLVLGLLEEAASAVENQPEATTFLVEAAWAVYNGAEDACSTLSGTADSRSINFGMPGDVNDGVAAAFEGALSDLNVDTIEALLDEVTEGMLVTFLRAVIRYANRMDEAAAAGEPDIVRENQFEGLAYLRVIQPLAAALDASGAEAIESAFVQGAESGIGEVDLENYEPVLGTVENAVGAILDAAGLDMESLGTYTEDDPTSG